MSGQEREQELQPRDQELFNIFYFLVNAYAWALLPFTRTQVGRNGMGGPALLAMFCIPWYAGKNHSEEMITYFWCWLAMVMWRRLTPGKGVVSNYQGWPYLTAWLVGDEMLARLVEAVLVFIAGNCLYGWSEAVGQFVACGGVALILKVWIEWMYISRQEEAIEDARIAMEVMMERSRKRR